MKNMMLIALLVFFPSVAALQISEIFFDAEGNDNNQEYIEITNYTTVTHIADLSSNDTLTLLKETNSSYALIVEEGFNYTLLNCTIYGAGPTIGNNLNNDADTVLIYNNETLLANSSYVANDSFIPGQSYYPQHGFAEPSPCTTLTFPSNTSSASNTTMNTTQCATNFSVDAPYYVIDAAWTFTFQLEPEPKEYTITYWIETYIGDVVKSPYTTANLKTKSFTPKTKLWYAAYILHATASFCNTTKNISRLFFSINDIPKQEEEPERETPKTSQANITYVYTSNSLEFGKPLNVKLTLRNIKASSDVSLFVQTDRIIAEKSFSFFRNSEATLTTQIDLPEDCTNSTIASLVLEAFNMKDTEELFVECPKKLKKKEQEIKTDTETVQKVEQEQTQKPENQSYSLPTTGDITKDVLVYESSAQKSTRTVPFILAIVGVLGTSLILLRVKKIYK